MLLHRLHCNIQYQFLLTKKVSLLETNNLLSKYSNTHFYFIDSIFVISMRVIGARLRSLQCQVH